MLKLARVRPMLAVCVASSSNWMVTMTQLRLLLCAVLFLFAGLAYSVAEAQPNKKFIELGWDIPSTSDFANTGRKWSRRRPSMA